MIQTGNTIRMVCPNACRATDPVQGCPAVGQAVRWDSSICTAAQVSIRRILRASFELPLSAAALHRPTASRREPNSRHSAILYTQARSSSTPSIAPSLSSSPLLCGQRTASDFVHLGDFIACWSHGVQTSGTSTQDIAVRIIDFLDQSRTNSNRLLRPCRCPPQPMPSLTPISTPNQRVPPALTCYGEGLSA